MIPRGVSAHTKLRSPCPTDSNKCFELNRPVHTPSSSKYCTIHRSIDCGAPAHITTPVCVAIYRASNTNTFLPYSPFPIALKSQAALELDPSTRSMPPRSGTACPASIGWTIKLSCGNDTTCLSDTDDGRTTSGSEGSMPMAVLNAGPASFERTISRRCETKAASCLLGPINTFIVAPRESIGCGTPLRAGPLRRPRSLSHSRWPLQRTN